MNDASIPKLMIRAVRDEVKRGLSRVLQKVIKRAPSPIVAPSRADVVAREHGVVTEAWGDPHENVVKAIQETESSVSSIRSETAHRRQWMYLLTEDAPELVVEFYGQPQGTPFRVGLNTIGKRMVAVFFGHGGKGRLPGEAPFTEQDVTHEPVF